MGRVPINEDEWNEWFRGGVPSHRFEYKTGPKDDVTIDPVSPVALLHQTAEVVMAHFKDGLELFLSSPLSAHIFTVYGLKTNYLLSDFCCCSCSSQDYLFADYS